MSLTIRLYKNVILTNEYKEGFNMRIGTSLDTYLSTKQYLQVYSGDDIYFTNNGSISIDNSGLTSFTANQYNYMAFFSSVGGVTVTRYCFVKSITLVNEVAVIEYEEDIWSNYSSSINLRYGYLTQAKRINNLTTEEKFLAKAYNTNQPETLSTVTGGTSKKCYVVLDVSFYNTVQDGLASNRLFYSILLGNRTVEIDENTQQEVAGTEKFNYEWNCDDDLARFLCQIKVRSSVDAIAHAIHYGNTDIAYDGSNPYYFEVTRVTLIPYDVGYGLFYTRFFENNELRKTLDNYFPFTHTGYRLADNPFVLTKTTPIMYTLSVLGGDEYNSWLGMEGNLPQTYSFKLSNDYTIKGLQNNSRFIALNPNGKDIYIEYRFVCSLNGSALLMNVNDEIIDITQDFIFNIPLNVQTADVTQQASIARNLSEINNGFNQIGNIWSGITGSANAIKQDSSMGFMGSFYGAMLKDEALKASQEAIAARKSVSNKAVSNFDMSFYNASIPYGYYIAKVNASNSADVTRYTNKFGYAYDNILVAHSDVFDALSQDNYLKFSNLVIYGNFSNDIMQRLKSILMNGIYLFSSSTV